MPEGILHTIAGVVVQLAVFLWIVGLGFSLIIKEHKKYLDLSKKHIWGFIRKHWRYVIVFLLGFLSGYPGSIHFITQ